MVIQVLENRVHQLYLVVIVDVVLRWVVVEVEVVPAVQLFLVGVDYFHQILGARFEVLVRNVFEVGQWFVNKFVLYDGSTNVDFR